MVERSTLALVLALGLACAPAHAQPAPEDAALEARVMAVADELRCLVCQNETIAASQSGLAVDLRQQIRSQLRAGASSQEVLDFMSARYGDFVLYRPPVKTGTVLLWIGPFLGLAGGLAWLAGLWRSRRREPEAPLSDAERAAARRLLQTPQEPTP